MMSTVAFTKLSNIFMLRQLQPACSVYTRNLNYLVSHNYNRKYYLCENSYNNKYYLSHVRAQNTKTDVSGVKSAEKLEHKTEIPEIINVNEELSLSRAEKLKKAVKEYGSTVIIFHISISLVSLGTCYLLVSSGLEIEAAFKTLGLEQWTANSQLATNAGTFAVAYAIHKVFAPVRIAITLGTVPFIVRYLRRIGFLKM